MKTSFQFLKEGGRWIGSLRTRVQTMFIRGNGESITWGSDEEIRPCPTMKELEELGAYAVVGYHNEKVEPMIELLKEVRERLRKEE
jgi:predicted urease superfamily metal-dependent hydrolase